MDAEAKFKASSQKLIKRFGRPLTYVSVFEGVYDDDLGEVVNTETQIPNIMMFASTPKYNEKQSPNLVDKNVTSFLISGADIAVQPRVNDKIVTEQSIYTVAEIKPYWSGGGVALWRLLSVEN